MAIDREDQDEREARIDMILEELRLNTEDMHELARQARERARRMREENRVTHAQVASRKKR